MDKKKLLFIFNPHSGKGQIRMQLVSIVDTFVKNGYEVTIYRHRKRKMQSIKWKNRQKNMIWLCAVAVMELWMRLLPA